MTTGEKIQALRKKRDLTQEQLAQELGVSRQAISRWELDETLPDTQNLLPLKAALGVSVDTLLDPNLGLEPPQGGSFPQLPGSPGKKSRLRWLWLLPLALAVVYNLVLFLVTWLLTGGVPSLTLVLASVSLCFWVYGLCVGVYVLWLLIRFLRQRLGEH